MDTMDMMDKNGLLNGQWTMDNGQWTMDRNRNGHDGHDGHDGQEWTAEWTIDNGRWTMDNGHVQQMTFFLRLSIRPSNGNSIESIPSMMSIRVPVH
jgi:hypothetical protein